MKYTVTLMMQPFQISLSCIPSYQYVISEETNGKSESGYPTIYCSNTRWRGSTLERQCPLLLVSRTVSDDFYLFFLSLVFGILNRVKYIVCQWKHLGKHYISLRKTGSDENHWATQTVFYNSKKKKIIFVQTDPLPRQLKLSTIPNPFLL